MTSRKNIGILTLHSFFNEGAILQSFSVSQNLKQVFPGRVIEVVDHRYPGKYKEVYGPADNEMKKTLAQFIDQGLPLSPFRVESIDRLKTFDLINQNYGAIVTGSDELWKIKYSSKLFGLRKEQNCPWHPAFPNVYWPDENVKVPKFSYAASIGSTDWREIPRKHREQMKAILRGYSLLGIRDERTRRFLEWLDPGLAARSEWVPDPTFSVDLHSFVDKQALKSKLESYGVDFKRPRIGTVLWDIPKINAVLGDLKAKGYQIIALSIANKMADVALYDKGLTPLEWFGVFGCVDLCFSLRMHGCISCILNGTPVVAVDFYSNQMDDESKLKDLFGRFGLVDYYFNPPQQTQKDLQQITSRILDGEYPVEQIQQKKIMFQQRSAEYTAKIKGALDGGGM